MQECPDAKKPCKGILKSSSSFDRPGACHRKSAKFDELNVLQTLHPPDKDYGHMKIEEPKTPYNYIEVDPEHADQLDADLLAEKLRIAANTQTSSYAADESLSDDDFPDTQEEKIRRMEFERRRKAHYNEYEAVKLARKLIEEELADDDEQEELTVGDIATAKSAQGVSEFSAIGGSCDGGSLKGGKRAPIVSEYGAGGAGNSPASGREMEVDQQFDALHSSNDRQ